jgi:hypothetical protein
VTTTTTLSFFLCDLYIKEKEPKSKNFRIQRGKKQHQADTTKENRAKTKLVYKRESLLKEEKKSRNWR